MAIKVSLHFKKACSYKEAGSIEIVNGSFKLNWPKTETNSHNLHICNP